MELRNKRTGEIIKNAYVRETDDFYRDNKRTIAVFTRDGNRPLERVSVGYNSLAELNAEWEDAPEEPKKYWTVDCGLAVDYTWHGEIHDLAAEAVGLKFDTKEECERAIEKMKAWTRLEEKGFRFKGWSGASSSSNQVVYCDFGKADASLLSLLFGGEE